MTQYDVEVFGDRVLILRDPMPDESEKTIILSDDIEQPPCTGVVLAVGEEVKYYKINDRVYFTQYAGHFLRESTDLEDSSYIVMREDEIIAKKVVPDEAT